MAYLRKLSSLEDMATSQLAINLCQDNSFKKATMHLKKSVHKYACHRHEYISEKVKEWDTAIDEQCQRLTDGLPHSLKQGVHIWMTRIALEYSSYTLRMKFFFEIPHDFVMNILTLRDWTENGRVNERRLAKRLLKDERLTVLQRYRIACVYCLHKSIPHLWNRLTSEEKQLISGQDDPRHSQEKNHFVLLWSYFMDGRREKKITYRQNLWSYATSVAVHYGNQAALMQCWKRLNKHAQKRIVVGRAVQSLQRWAHIRSKEKWRDKLIFYKYSRSCKLPQSFARFNLPSHYSEMMRFFLSKMSKHQQILFFENAFADYWRSEFDPIHEDFPILDFLLEWPLQDHFIVTIKRLWGKIPKDIYGRCLLSLAIKYSGDYDRRSSSSSFYKKDNLYYDYRSVLWNLWEETPEEYKQYVFSDVLYWDYCYKSVIEHMLPHLLTRSPFQEEDVTLFKRIWDEVPQDVRKAAIYEKDEKNICLILVEKGMWYFINWLLEDCLSDLEILSFKPSLAESDVIRRTCFMKLKENCEKYVEGFIDWVFESDTDKLEFRYEIIKNYGVTHCGHLLRAGEYVELERMINFCLSSEEMKLQLKEEVVKEACHVFLKNCAWEEMDKSISWIFDEEEKIKKFKKDFFYSDDSVFDIHLGLVFNANPSWKNVTCFYTWFCLSSEEIIELKNKTILSPRVIDAVHQAVCERMILLYRPLFYVELDLVIASLCWCLTNDKMVISLREELKKYFLEQKVNRSNNKVWQRLDYLVSKLSQSSQKEVVHDKTNKRGSEMTVKDNRGKKSLIVDEDKFNSSRKRFKKNTLK